MKYGNHEDLYELLRSDQVDLVLNDQRRAFSDEYVNMLLTVIDCHIEISARNPIAGLEYVNAGDLRRTPCILVASKDQQENGNRSAAITALSGRSITPVTISRNLPRF